MAVLLIVVGVVVMVLFWGGWVLVGGVRYVEKHLAESMLLP